MAETPVVVDTTWLSDHLDDGIAVVDVRFPQFYQQAHIFGAVNFPSYEFGGPARLPDSAALARRLASLGITRDTHVVGYDDGASPDAAGLFWLLTYFGHPAVSVLDGGITKWRHDGRDWEYGPVQPSPASYEIGEADPSVLADLQAVRAALEADDTVILDVRSPAEYLGLQATAAHNGHVPGAINVDWSNNLDALDGAVAVLRPDAELRDLYAQAGVTPDKQVIIYCQTGHRASETFLVLRKLGFERVATYGPGWQEWGNRSDVPVDEG